MPARRPRMATSYFLRLRTPRTACTASKRPEPARNGNAKNFRRSINLEEHIRVCSGARADIAARVPGDEFQKVTGQGFVVINKPGAFGMLAIDEMAKSAPDGYTLMLGNVSTNTITPIIYASKMNVDYGKNVMAVTN